METKTTKELQQEINKDIFDEILNRRQNLKGKYYKIHNYIGGYDLRVFMPLTPYTLRKLQNNKPLTLLNEKEKHPRDFVAFVNINTIKTHNGEEWTKKVFFDINQDKKTISCGDWLPTSYAWKDARKDEGTIYILLNKDIKTRAEKLNKHNQRQKAKEQKNPFDRFPISEKSMDRNWAIARLIEKKYFHHHYYNFNINDFDKNGYFVKGIREELTQRAAELKREREQARRERITQEWQQSDHTQQAAEVAPYLAELKTLILEYSDFEKLLIKSNFDILEKLRRLYKDFNSLLYFNDFKNIDHWTKEKEETIAEYNFYITAIDRGAFSRLACFHQYEKTPTGYKMKDTEKDPFWRDPARYIQQF